MQTKRATLESTPDSFWARCQCLSTSHKFIIVVFIIWLVQALPKWTVAITADGQLSATIMKVFVTPRSERAQKLREASNQLNSATPIS